MIRRKFEEDPTTADVNKADNGKLRLTLVPRGIIRAIAMVRMYGLQKYRATGEHGWRKVSTERYRDAAFRHFVAYLDDPHGRDKESGLPHLWHLACNVAFLCELEDLHETTGSHLDGSHK